MTNDIIDKPTKSRTIVNVLSDLTSEFFSCLILSRYLHSILTNLDRLNIKVKNMVK